MNTEITGDEPAMPIYLQEGLSCNSHVDIGLTQREYACIQLELPETGVEWLDKLIAKKQRQSIAAKAMEGLLSCNAKYGGKTDNREDLCKDAIAFSNALISELNKTVEP